jgi:hypothetical protein
MNSHQIAESGYPLTFRKHDASSLGSHLSLRHSVEIVGIKRVGISNFLRFFLYHPKIVREYISKEQNHLFIPVDLNDLVEREIQPFWILTFKRLVDVTEEYTVKPEIKQKISSLFLQSIQLQDNFLTIENIKKALLLLISENILPTIFLLRFDRMKEAATPEFFNNIQGLIAATHNQLALVFTSDRPLDQIRPDIFSREELTTFCHVLYLLPANTMDASIIFKNIQAKYDKLYSPHIHDIGLRLSGGHMQYLYLINSILYEQFKNRPGEPFTPEEMSALILKDERITLQSEEIFESLTPTEKTGIKKLIAHMSISHTKELKYIVESGILQNDTFFSPLFEEFLKKKTSSPTSIEFSKKEHLLYSLLKDNLNEICERDVIIHYVWPESEETGVSDWTIDRLVARLRQKLSAQKSEYSVLTVKTRGYKLVQS